MEEINPILIIALLVGIVLLGKLLFSSKPKFSTSEQQDIMYRITQIESSLDRASRSELRDSVVRADNIFAKVLQKYLNNQETLGNNLKKSSSLFEKEFYQDLWDAHKMRNEVVHGELEIDIEYAQYAVSTFKKAIKRLIYN